MKRSLLLVSLASLASTFAAGALAPPIVAQQAVVPVPPNVGPLFDGVRFDRTLGERASDEIRLWFRKTKGVGEDRRGAKEKKEGKELHCWRQGWINFNGIEEGWCV